MKLMKKDTHVADIKKGCEIVKKDIEGFGEEIEYIVLRRAFIKQTMN